MLFGGKPRINMDLKCFDNAGAELGLTIDAIYQQPLAYTSPPRDTLIKVTDDTGRIRAYRRNRLTNLRIPIGSKWPYINSVLAKWPFQIVNLLFIVAQVCKRGFS